MPKPGHIPVELIKSMASRPEGVSGKEIAAKGFKYSTAAVVLSKMRERGELTLRRGPVRGSMTARYWLKAETAEKFEFPATAASETRDNMERLIRQQHGTVRELSQRSGLSPKGVTAVALDLFNAGRIHRTEVAVRNCLPVLRFFGTAAEMEEWLAENGTLKEQQARNAIPMLEARRQKLRERYRKHSPEVARSTEGMAKKSKSQALKQKSKDAIAANRIAKTMAKSAKVAAVKLARLPPALQPGEPIITEQTKVTRLARPLGRYEVGHVGSQVFSANRPGIYDEEPSTWAAAAARLAA